MGSNDRMVRVCVRMCTTENEIYISKRAPRFLRTAMLDIHDGHTAFPSGEFQFIVPCFGMRGVPQSIHLLVETVNHGRKCNGWTCLEYWNVYPVHIGCGVFGTGKYLEYVKYGESGMVTVGISNENKWVWPHKRNQTTSIKRGYNSKRFFNAITHSNKNVH